MMNIDETRREVLMPEHVGGCMVPHYADPCQVDALERHEQALRLAFDAEPVPCPMQVVTEIECVENCRVCHGACVVPRVVAETRSNPEIMRSIRRGVEDAKAGRVVSWRDLKRELSEEPTP